MDLHIDIHRNVLLFLDYDKFMIYYEIFAVNSHQAAALLSVIKENTFWLTKLKLNYKVNHLGNDWKNVFIILHNIQDNSEGNISPCLDKRNTSEPFESFEVISRNIDDTNSEFVNAIVQCQGYSDVVQIMLDNELLDPQVNEQFALKWAIRHDHRQILEMLINRGSIPLTTSEPVFAFGQDELHSIRLVEPNEILTHCTYITTDVLNFSLEYGSIETIDKLVCRMQFLPKTLPKMLNEFMHKRPDWATAFILKTGTLLHVVDPLGAAVSWNNRKLAEAVLANPKINIGDRLKAMRIATTFNRNEILALLLKDGRIDPVDGNQSCSSRLIKRGNLESVRLLLEDGRIDASHNNNEALKLAIEKDYHETVDLIASHVGMSEDDKSIMYLRYGKKQDGGLTR